jgi:hypothetical protein
MKPDRSTLPTALLADGRSGHSLAGNPRCVVALENDPQTSPLHPSVTRGAPTTVLDRDEVLETGEPQQAHIVRTMPGENAAAKVLEARINGTPLEALCGHVWVPSRDPKQLPLCEQCKEIYEMYRSFHDGLNDRPAE